MSWSLSTIVPARANVSSVLADARAKSPTQEATVEAREQIDGAVEMVDELIVRGVLGDPDKFDFSVSLSGHANASHEPAPGWSNDSVSINIYQRPPATTADAAGGAAAVA